MYYIANIYIASSTSTVPVGPACSNGGGPQPITINAATHVRTVDARVFGINTAIWDGSLASSSSLLTQGGFTSLRFPGGSLSDDVRASLHSPHAN